MNKVKHVRGDVVNGINVNYDLVEVDNNGKKTLISTRLNPKENRGYEEKTFRIMINPGTKSFCGNLIIKSNHKITAAGVIVRDERDSPEGKDFPRELIHLRRGTPKNSNYINHLFDIDDVEFFNVKQ